MVGGVFFNIVLAALIYVMMLFTIGDEHLPVRNLEYGIEVGELGEELGLQTGDQIVAVNGGDPGYWSSMLQDFARGDVRKVEVMRNDSLVTIDVPEDFFGKIISSRGSNFIYVRFPFIVSELVDGDPAKQAGMQEGDRIKGIDAHETWSFAEFIRTIEDLPGKETTINH